MQALRHKLHEGTILWQCRPKTTAQPPWHSHVSSAHNTGSCAFASTAPSSRIGRHIAAPWTCTPGDSRPSRDGTITASTSDSSALTMATPQETAATAAEASPTAADVPKIPPGAASPAAPTRKQRVPPIRILPPRILDLAPFQNGVLMVDKPLGWTSFDVCGKLRNMLRFQGVKKVGHAGTLDPMATGLLVVCTGAATKFCDDFMAQDKEYSGTIRLGEGTASYDAESAVNVTLPWDHITDEQIAAAASRFVGDIMQIPPMFSAIKVQGQKLYDLAREGTTIERMPRPVTINALRVWRATPGGQDLHFHVACSKGTYIRSLAHDLGAALGSAAHLTALRREASGELRAADAWPMALLVEELNRVRDEHRAANPLPEAAPTAAAGKAAPVAAAAAVGV